MNWWRNCSTAVSSDGQRTKTLQNYRRRLSLPKSHFWPTKTRESTPANANNSALAKKPIKKLSILSWTKVGSNLYQPRKTIKAHQGGLGDSEYESDAEISSVPDSETGQQSAPHIQLEQIPRQPQQGNADTVLVENNFDTTYVTWRSKCASAQL